MLSFLKRTRLEAEDWLRYQPWNRRALAEYKLLRIRTPDAPAR